MIFMYLCRAGCKLNIDLAEEQCSLPVCTLTVNTVAAGVRDMLVEFSLVLI